MTDDADARMGGQAASARAEGGREDVDPGLPDGALMAAWCAGDEAAFATLYGRWSGRSWRFLVRQCGAERAQELHQETWMAVIRGRAAYRDSARFSGWLFTLARNCVIDDARRRGVRPDQDHAGEDPDVLAAAGVGADPVEEIDRQRAAHELGAALDRLPRNQREVVMLRWEGGLSLPEIAALTETTLDTVKSRLRYALGHLRKELSADGG